MKNKNPYLPKEKEIMDNLINAYNKFYELNQTHPSHLKEFEFAVHQCQRIIEHRIVQRTYPDYFPIKNKNIHINDLTINGKMSKKQFNQLKSDMKKWIKEIYNVK